MMLKVKGDHYKRFVAGGREYQIVWDTNSVAALDGCLVIAVDFSRPVGQREIYRKSGLEHELNTLQHEAEQLIERLAESS